VTLVEILPHVSGALNALVATLLIAGFVAIRRGHRTLHPRLMLGAFGVGLVFLACYATQVILTGHRRFPGDDWVRTVFLAILLTHTALAVSIVPLVLRTLYLAYHRRFVTHRWWARITFPVWVYVAVTGVVIYWMNNHLRPPPSPTDQVQAAAVMGAEGRRLVVSPTAHPAAVESPQASPNPNGDQD
jgi:putative membrane protein